MSTTRYASDRGLVARMGLTMFLLGLLYVVLMVLLYAIGVPAPFVILIAGGGLWAQWYFSDRIALYGMGGHEVTPEEAPQLHAVIDRLCAMADMPKPRVAIADTDMPNAFATGRSPSRAVVCATTGIMRRLEPRELEGVLAHELSHVAHRDVTVMTIASFVAVLAGMLTRTMMWGGMMGGGRRRGNDNNAAAVAAVAMLVSVLVYLFSFVLIRSLSRYRELSADRTGALLTGQPSALASALVKITGDMGRIPTKDLRQAESFNAFFFIPAFSGNSLSSLLSTHPSLDKRLENLQKVQLQLNRPTG